MNNSLYLHYFTLLLFIIGFSLPVNYSFAQTTVVEHNFDVGNDGWSTSSGWLRDGSSFSGNTTGHWHTDPFNDYGPDMNVMATSSSIDLSAFETMTLSFNFRHQTESSWDGVQVQYAISGGAWTVLGASGEGTNWYNDSDVDAIGDDEDGWSGNNSSWATSSLPLPALFDGQSDVKFQFLFASDGSVYDDGVAFDDFKIEGTQLCNAPVASFTTDNTACGAGTFAVVVNVTDMGDADAIIITDDQGGTWDNGGAGYALGDFPVSIGAYAAGLSVVATVDDDNVSCPASSSALSEDCICPNAPAATTATVGLDCTNSTYDIEVTVTNYGDGSSADIKIDGTTVQASANIGQTYTFMDYATGSHTVTVDAQPYAPYITCKSDNIVTLSCNGSDDFSYSAPNILGTCSAGDLSVATVDGPTNFGAYCWNGGVSGMSNNYMRHCSGSFDNETDYQDLWYQVDLPDGADEMTLTLTGLGATEYVGYALHTEDPVDDSGANLVVADSDGQCTFFSSTVTSHTITGLSEESTAPIYIRIVPVNPNQNDPCSSIIYAADFEICAFAPQPNDVCGNAIDITENNAGTSWTGDISAANQENNDEWDCAGTLLSNGDLWYDIVFPDIPSGVVPFHVELTIDGPTGASVVAAIYDVTTACGGISLGERDACETLTFASPVTTNFGGLETNDGFQRELQITPVTPNIGDITVSAVVTTVNNTCEHFTDVLPGFDITSWSTVDFNWATDSGVAPVTAGRDLWYTFDPESENDNGIPVYSTTIDIQLASLNSGEVITALLYEGHTTTSLNCDDLASRFISSVEMSLNGTEYRLSCMDELHGGAGTDGGYLIRFVQTAGATVAVPDILVTPDVNAGPYNNDCENIWDGNGPKNTGTGDAAHGYSAWHILDGEFGTGHFDGATDCSPTTGSGVCNSVDYEAITELNDRDVWFTFEVPDDDCASTGLSQSTIVENVILTYGAGSSFRDAILYVYSDCGDANLIDCSGALDGGGTSGAGADWAVSGLTQGESYLLRVKPYDDGNEYDFSFTVDVNVGLVSPCNNDATGGSNQGAYNLPVNSCNDYESLETWSAQGATESTPVDGAPEKDVWFTFTAPDPANGGGYTTTKSWVTVFFESVTSHTLYLDLYNTSSTSADGELYSTTSSAGAQDWAIFGNLTPGHQYYLRLYHKEALSTEVLYKINVYDGTGVEPGWECGVNSYSNISGCASGCNTLSETWFKIDLPENTPGNAYWMIEVKGQDQELDFELRSKYLMGNSSYVSCSGTEGASEGGCADFDHPCSSTALEGEVSISSTTFNAGCDGDGDQTNNSGVKRVYFNMNGAVTGQKDYYYLRVFETSGSVTKVKICDLDFNGPYSTQALAETGNSPDLECLAPLPVELSSFDARAVARNNEIAWMTSSEENTEKFIIERSNNGFRTMEVLGEVKAEGDLYGTQNYQFLDESPITKAYYRLKIMDFDGYFDYSEIKLVERKIETLNIISVVPNPAKDFVTVHFNAPKLGTGILTIIDVLGRELHEKSVSIQSGSNTHRLDISNYPIGVFFLNINQGKHTVVEKIVKRE